MIFIVYGLVFLAIGVGTMIAIRAQREYESAEPVLGEVPKPPLSNGTAQQDGRFGEYVRRRVLPAR